MNEPLTIPTRSVIAKKSGAKMIYYAGRTNTHLYWCKTENRALKYIIQNHANIEIDALKKFKGNKRCFLQNCDVLEATQQNLNSIPALYHEKIKK